MLFLQGVPFHIVGTHHLISPGTRKKVKIGARGSRKVTAQQVRERPFMKAAIHEKMRTHAS